MSAEILKLQLCWKQSRDAQASDLKCEVIWFEITDTVSAKRMESACSWLKNKYFLKVQDKVLEEGNKELIQ